MITTARPSKFGGRCARPSCGQYVRAGEGLLAGKPGHWSVTHAGDCPAKPVAAAAGVCQVSDMIYVVRPGKTSPGHAYACCIVLNRKRLSEAGQPAGFDLERVPGLVCRLTEDDRMPFAEANAFSAIHGQCIACGAVLKLEKTIKKCQESGIWVGPDCRAAHYPESI